jgi:hypothetical protein
LAIYCMYLLYYTYWLLYADLFNKVCCHLWIAFLDGRFITLGPRDLWIFGCAHMVMAVVTPVEHSAIIFSWEVAIHGTSGLA